MTKKQAEQLNSAFICKKLRNYFRYSIPKRFLKQVATSKLPRGTCIGLLNAAAVKP